jgi:uncharacterized repeat protein (TIGR01451 family)
MKTFYKFLLIPMLATLSFNGFAQLNVTMSTCNLWVPIYYKNSATCGGYPCPFEATVNGGTPPYHYQWSPSLWLSNDTIYNPNCQPPSLVHDTTILYTVIVTDSIGNADTASQSIDIYHNVIPPIITCTAPNNTICQGMSTSLSFQPTPGYNYQWLPSGSLSSQYGTSVTATPPSSTIYTLGVFHGPCYGTTAIWIWVNNCPYNIIRSTAFNDINNNGIRDTGEYRMQNIIPKITPAASVLSYIFDTSLTAYVGTGTFNVAPDNAPYYTQTTNPWVTFTGFTSDVTRNIGLYGPPGIKDIKVDITTYYWNLLGSGATLYCWGWLYYGGGFTSDIVRYSNIGTDTLNGVLKIKYDAQYDTFSLHPMVSNSDHFVSNVNDTITWQYYDLLPGESRELYTGGHITNPMLGNTLQVAVVGYPILGDSNPANNYDTCYQLITGSWDPNFKEVNHDSLSLSMVMAGTPLTYTIHFQNTGNDTAIFVKVRDTISPKLNKATFEMISASHPYILTDTTGNVIQWKFNNIMLPDSGANQLLSNGFIKYRITPFTSLNDGDSIENHASIYFNNNAPVMTNRAMTYIEKIITSANELNTSPIVLSPNPTTGLVNIQLPPQFGRMKTLEIYNVVGQLQPMQSRINGFDISSFSPGLYFVVLRNEKGEMMRGKVVKE